MPMPLASSSSKTFGVGDDFLRPGNNSIGFLRLVLASLVVLSHAFVLRGLTPPGHMFAKLAVSGFFFLSGMLITQSYLHSNSLKDYLWRRTLRIFPGFWGCLFFSAFVVTPIAMWLQHKPFPIGAAAGYVGHGLPMVGGRISVGDVFAQNPVGNVMNGSLWTLPLEYFCYLVVGCAGVVGLLRHRWLLVGCSAILYLWHVVPETRLPAVPHAPNGLIADNVLEPYLMFAIGTAAHLWRERIRFPNWAGPLALLAVAIIVSYELPSDAFQMASRAIRVVALPVTLVWLATVLPLKAFDRKRDLSYGTYIYAYPIQQLIIVAGVSGGWLVFSISYGLTLGMAFLSWCLVEGPAMRLKKVFAKRTPTPSGHVAGPSAG